ncbi:MAG: putative RND superfamily exporter protein [Gammaproteobacteria bacterium]|jgi:predicted RND superfamily exporter protein
MRLIPHNSVLVLLLVSIVICLYGLTGLKTNADYRVYFDQDDPLLQTDNQLGAQYAQLDSLILILSTEDDTLLEPVLINIYTDFEKQLSNVKYVERVTAFFQFVDEDINFDASLDSDENQEPEDLLHRLRTHSRSTNLITADGRYGLLNIGVSFPGENTAKEVKQFMTEVKSVIGSQIKSKNLGIAVNFSGTLALNEAYIDVVRHDLKRFVPCLFLIFSICLFAFFRSWPITFLLIGTALLSAISAFGVAGWLHWELAAINAFTPIIIMSLNIATSMHVVVNYFRHVADGHSREDAMAESIDYNFKALTLSKITTAAGFLLLAFSPSPPVNVVGYIVATGMVISYVLCLTFLRSLLPKIKLSSAQAKRVVERFSLYNLGGATLKYSNKILMFSGVIVVVGLISIMQLKINDNVYEYFPEDHSFRQGTKLIDDHFDGSIRLLYSVDSLKPFGVLEADYTKRLTEFTDWLRKQEIVARVDDVLSLATNKGVRLDTIQPVLEVNSPSFFGLEQDLTKDYQAVKVSVFLKTVTAKELIAFDSKVRSWLGNNITPYNYKGGVGPDILFAKLGERNARSMFFSLGLALVVIALIIGGLLRSWSATLIGLICNLFPVVTVFALWSLIGGYISLGSAMVMGMIMGIIVDDTLHMLLKYPRALNATVTSSVLTLYEKVCPAILITSITLAAGLFVGIFSGFRPIYELSLLSLSIILVAMLADLFLLPALLHVMKFKRA